MTTATDLIEQFLELKQDIKRRGTSPRTDAVYQILSMVVKLMDVWVKHERNRNSHADNRIPFFDDASLAKAATSENVKQLRKVSKEVSQVIKERRNA